MNFGYDTVLQDHVEAVNNIAAVHKRFCCNDFAVYAVAQRSGENFLCWHVCNKLDSALAEFGSGHPNMIFRQFNSKIRSERICIVERFEIVSIELFALFFKNFAMLAPTINGITAAGYANRFEDLFPQFLHCLFFRKVGEDLLCP